MSATQDKIVYSQQNGKSGTYLQYVPGDGSKPTTQPVTGAGGCATPNAVNPVLAFTANRYLNGYDQPPSGAIVGAFDNRTGVCSIPPAWGIEVSEGLDFAPGPNPLTTGRVFLSAVLNLARNDSGGTLTGRLVERLHGTQVHETPFSINSTPISIDTHDVTPNGFDSLEVQVTTPAAGSVSVVGPTSTFYFAPQLCPGQSITDTSAGGTQTSGEVTATVTYDKNSTAGCKAFTFFNASSTDTASSDGKSVTFLSQQFGGTAAHVTVQIDWGNVPYCRDDATADPSVPPCPTTIVDFGTGEHPEVYCSAATTAHPYCSTFKQFTYVPDPANPDNTVAHEVEDLRRDQRPLQQTLTRQCDELDDTKPSGKLVTLGLMLADPQTVGERQQEHHVVFRRASHRRQCIRDELPSTLVVVFDNCDRRFNPVGERCVLGISSDRSRRGRK